MIYKAIIPVLIYYLFAIWGEAYLSNLISWFKPDLFFLFATILCLHWKGTETLFIYLFFGITADCFSSLPFGLFGLTFFMFAFFTRWYAVKIYQDYLFTLPIICGFFTFAVNLVVFLVNYLIFSDKLINFNWIQNLIIYQVLPVAVLTIPSYLILLKIEAKFKIKLSLRKF